MADRKLTADDLLAGLADIRLPAEAAGGLAAELFAALGLGLLLALAISAVLPLITKRKTVSSRRSVRERIKAARALPDSERTIALLHLLKEKRPEIAERMNKTIYAPGGLPEPSVLEAELGKADA